MKEKGTSTRSLIFELLASSARVGRRLDQQLGNISGISFSEYQILAALKASHKGAATRVQLARDVGLTPSGVTRALRPMEKIGLVETLKDERDARRSLATLTAAGLRTFKNADEVVNDTIDALAPAGDLSPARHAQILAWLEALADA